MQEHNPYAAPSANLGGKDSYGEETGGVTKGVVDQLARTKGWTRFSGVLLIISSAVVLLLIAFVSTQLSKVRVFRQIPEGIIYVIFAIYAAAAVLILVAGVKLNGFSSAIRRLLFSGRESDLDDALDRQRSFWVYCGILAIIWLVFVGLAILGGIASPRGPI